MSESMKKLKRAFDEAGRCMPPAGARERAVAAAMDASMRNFPPHAKEVARPNVSTGEWG